MVETGVVFAGGKSSRMGCDKALLPYKSHPTLSQFQYEKLKKIFKNVYISTKDSKFDFDANLIFDIYTQSSPLVALVSIFGAIKSDEVFVLSVDAPLVDYNTIHKLLEIAKNERNKDAIIARSTSGIEPLCGVYRRSIVPLANNFLKRDSHKLTSLLGEAQSIFVDFEDVNLFTNLNTPSEYEKVKLL